MCLKSLVECTLSGLTWLARQMPLAHSNICTKHIFKSFLTQWSPREHSITLEFILYTFWIIQPSPSAFARVSAFPINRIRIAKSSKNSHCCFNTIYPMKNGLRYLCMWLYLRLHVCTRCIKSLNFILALFVLPSKWTRRQSNTWWYTSQGGTPFLSN